MKPSNNEIGKRVRVVADKWDRETGNWEGKKLREAEVLEMEVDKNGLFKYRVVLDDDTVHWVSYKDVYPLRASK